MKTPFAVVPSTDGQNQAHRFSDFGRRQVVVDFSGGHFPMDGGALLLRQLDCDLGLTARLAQVFTDRRELLSQRCYDTALRCDDLNDHLALRRDPLRTERSRKRPGNLNFGSCGRLRVRGATQICKSPSSRHPNPPKTSPPARAKKTGGISGLNRSQAVASG